MKKWSLDKNEVKSKMGFSVYSVKARTKMEQNATEVGHNVSTMQWTHSVGQWRHDFGWGAKRRCSSVLPADLVLVGCLQCSGCPFGPVGSNIRFSNACLFHFFLKKIKNIFLSFLTKISLLPF